MASNGRPVELSFTPDFDGIVKVTATFSCEGSGSDWGAGREGKVFCEQGGVTSYAGGMRMGTARLPYSITGNFPVVAGVLVKAGFYGNVTGASTVTFYDVKVTVDYTA